MKDCASCRYNSRFASWSRLPGMAEGREGAAGALFQGSLVVCGGADRGWDLASCEAFDTTTFTWTKLPSMNLPRFNKTSH